MASILTLRPVESSLARSHLPSMLPRQLAGHAVCPRQLRIPFSSVTMHPHMDALHNTVPPRRSTLTQWLVIYAAGAAANVVWQNFAWDEAWTRGGAADLDNILRHSRPYVRNEADFTNIVHAAEEHAVKLLREHERDVETVARHLLESRSLTRDLMNSRIADAHRLEPYLDGS